MNSQRKQEKPRETLHYFRVESCEDGRWTERGRVYLPDDAPPHEVEAALEGVGVYAPRGADLLRWNRLTWDARRATVYASDGEPLARLTPIARGAYATVDDALEYWLGLRRRNPRAASLSIWEAPGGGFFVGGARLGPPLEGTSDLRGSRRVYRLRRLKRGGPIEVRDERIQGSAWVELVADSLKAEGLS